MKITVDISNLTLGDLEDMEAGKIASVVRILTEFSDLSRDEVRAIPLKEIKDIMGEIGEAVKKVRADAVPFETKPD